MDLYIRKDGKNVGPLTSAQARQGIAAGRFQLDDQATVGSTNSWTNLEEALQLLEPPTSPTSADVETPAKIPIEVSGSAKGNSDDPNSYVFCESCGTKMNANSCFCPSCGVKVAAIFTSGTTTPLTPRVPAVASQLNSKPLNAGADKGANSALFVIDPVGAMQNTFEELGPQKASLVGILFAVISNFCVIVGLVRLLDKIMSLVGFYFGQSVDSSALSSASQIDLTKPALIGFLPFIVLLITLFLARLIFREKGASLKDALAGDTFVAGATLLPLGFFVLISSLLGIGNIELIAALFLFAICYTVLILFAGLTRIAKIADFGAAFSVPVVILSSAYLLKVIVSSLYDAGALN